MSRYLVTAGRKVWQTGVAYVEAGSLAEAEARAAELEDEDYRWHTGDEDGPSEVEYVEPEEA